jgi:hypothetical protein
MPLSLAVSLRARILLCLIDSPFQSGPSPRMRALASHETLTLRRSAVSFGVKRTKEADAFWWPESWVTDTGLTLRLFLQRVLQNFSDR